MSVYGLSRRSFLAGIGAASGLAAFLRMAEAQEEGPVPLQRFLVIQRPVGTIQQYWWPEAANGSVLPTSFPRIMQPFAPLRERMIVLRHLQLPHEGSVGGGHERGTVILVTGRRTRELYPGNGGDDPVAEGPSVDQLFLEAPSLSAAPIRSIQLSCDNRADTPEVSTRHLSYSGRRAPMRPYYQPLEAYERIFGTLMPGGANFEALERARLQKKSVLDFALKDLARLRTLAPASQRERLDAHEAAIRELEAELQSNPMDPGACGVPEPPERVDISTRLDRYTGGNVNDHIVPERDDVKHDQIGRMHLAVVKAAFRCDLTRVVTFQWSPGTNHVSFGGMWPPNEGAYKVHHTTSHDPPSDNRREFLARVETWYSERVSAFLQELAETDDVMGGGKLLDNTLVPYVTEVSMADHDWGSREAMPLLLFGGPGVHLRGGRIWSSPSGSGNRGHRSTNDMWMACARAFGLHDFVLGESDLHTQPLEGLFDV